MWQVSSNFFLNHVVNPVFQTSNFGWFINPYPSKRQLIEDGNSSHLTGGLSALATHCRTSCSSGVTIKASRNKAKASCGWCFGSSFKDNKMLHPVEFIREPQFLWVSRPYRRRKMTYRLIMAIFWPSMWNLGCIFINGTKRIIIYTCRCSDEPSCLACWRNGRMMCQMWIRIMFFFFGDPDPRSP